MSQKLMRITTSRLRGRENESLSMMTHVALVAGRWLVGTVSVWWLLLKLLLLHFLTNRFYIITFRMLWCLTAVFRTGKLSGIIMSSYRPVFFAVIFFTSLCWLIIKPLLTVLKCTNVTWYYCQCIAVFERSTCTMRETYFVVFGYNDIIDHVIVMFYLLTLPWTVITLKVLSGCASIEEKWK